MAHQRRHTLYFLAEAATAATVFLDTEVDASRLLEHRAAARRDGRKYSIVTYILHESARVLARHPEANAAVRGRRALRVARYPDVDVKLTLDKTMAGQRVVLSAVLPAIDRASLAEIQEQVDHYAGGDPALLPEFAGLRLLHRLPRPAGQWAFRRVVRPLGSRNSRFGTLAVTSLGHRPVDGFHSSGGTTVTLGVGRILQRPVARDGAVVIAPVLRLNLAFDHRVIDGAEAADVLAEVKDALEQLHGLAKPAAEHAVTAPPRNVI
jgi:pyruvate/2-oxoglutarate dehydrogenase complex dihydrolipoamide acyltransferase (E2) component